MLSIFKDWLLDLIVWEQVTDPFEETESENELELNLEVEDEAEVDHVELIKKKLIEEKIL